MDSIFKKRLLWEAVFSVWILLLTCAKCNVLDEGNTRLERRAGLDFLGGLSGDGGGSGAAGAPDPTAGLKDPCGQIPLTVDSWNKLEVDKYIANYPGIDNLTLAQFAAKLEAPNFFCGIGMQCLAGQICSPAVGINWLILYAIQEWNNYMNSLYSSIENAITVMREAAAGIVADFMPDQHVDKSIFGWGMATIVLGVVGVFSAIAVPVFMPTELTLYAIEGYKTAATTAETAESVKAALAAAEAAKNAGDEATVVALRTAQDIKVIRTGFLGLRIAQKPPKPIFQFNPQVNAAFQRTASSSSHVAPTARMRRRSFEATSLEPRSLAKRDLPPSVFSYLPLSRYDVMGNLIRWYLLMSTASSTAESTLLTQSRWAFLDTHLTSLQNRLQGIVALTSKIGATAPIGAGNGLASVLQGGTFLTPNPVRTDLQKAARDLAQITAISQFFKSIDPCTDKGPDGAWPGDDRLSYCTPQGVMMNIIQANGNAVDNGVKNAKLLSTKYGYSVQKLVQSAVRCQTKYGIGNEMLAPPPSSPDSECAFALPVCVCTLADVQHLRHHGHSTVVACRNGAHLPI
ncbi:uncharacterized protein MELLADRAFT_88663 [Melampsora larici-populina 98AG31]|uniref:DUF7872 domain-containing protein n=1 Tax=Melampsora larici-populina (strain 98AG31 / pathotype 3-4-7) TaxID=747676 RepID=F4RSJ4_MELLP|nr:uncharacterized protein MELLADRAFT_88663 [Melampsora larici-populina 98AG31]EGG04612.1 hypothetical protein MELLADRAFT_88663 [Melampsora larici-populina 98AG31]